MDTSRLREYFSSLPPVEQNSLLLDLETIKDNSDYPILEQREYKLNNKQGCCPHCGNAKYVKAGKYSGTQRYKCKKCNKSFSPYTNTWLAQIHHKEKIPGYLRLMRQGLSLEKIKKKLGINKKTAFDWRQKINISLRDTDQEMLKGISESDETFFLHSQKGSPKLDRKARNRGKAIKKRGIGGDQVAVIVSADRDSSLTLTATGFGRITKKEIEKAIGDKVSEQTILCSDAHVSYKGFSMDKHLEHHALQSNIKEFVKNNLYHIQHVNSLHSRLKKWINCKLNGVATKYLQNYLDWFRFSEKFKTTDYMHEIMEQSMQNTNAREQYLYALKRVYSDKYAPF